MKREIKFRKWHKELTDMTFWDGSKGSNNLFWHTLTESPEMYVLMQFTGLHDENGKEIYEGDIIGHKEKDNEDNIYICEFSIENAAFLFCSPFDGEVLEQNNFVNDLEIIGNIYENPDLL
jgi:uncharacterized phage protein (TIGR01671 family)